MTGNQNSALARPASNAISLPPFHTRRDRERPIAPPPTPALSIVVPTKNEAENIEELLRRIAAAAAGFTFEVIFVDDSTDSTADVIERSRGGFTGDVKVVHRGPYEQGDGLGGAVVEGMRIARAPWVCVMDGDLQHPPEVIPALMAEADRTGADLVVASRYRTSHATTGFGPIRALISRGSTAGARLLFPIRLRDVTDPMSGFFLVRREAVDLDALRPQGFKILLEIIGRTPDLRLSEVPFRFGSRRGGRSKASLREGVRYLQVMFGLRFATNRTNKRVAVGAGGAISSVHPTRIGPQRTAAHLPERGWLHAGNVQ